MKRFFCFVLTVLLFCLSAGCKWTKDPNGYPLTVGDITLNEQPKKIAVTSYALKSAMESLGFGGVTVDATAVFVSGVGDLTGGDSEVGVVLTNEELYPAQKTALQGAGVPVIKLKLPETLVEMRSYWETLGGIANGNKGALSAAASFEHFAAEILNLKKIKETTAVVLYDKEHCAVSGLAAEALTTAGYKNVATDMEITPVRLKELEPEYIFITSGSKEQFMSDEAFIALVAVANLQVFEVDVIGMTFGTQKLFSEIKYMNSVAPAAEIIEGTTSLTDTSLDVDASQNISDDE